jgi:facilitated trehalose transporter
MLYILVCGTFLSWKNQILVCFVVPIIGFVLTIFVPESPRYLLSKGLQTEGIKSLCWLRGASESQQIKGELFELMQNVEENRAEPLHVRIMEMKNPAVRHAAILGFGLFMFQVLTGVTAVLFYTVYIFEAAGTDIDEYTSSIIVGGIGIIPGLLATVAVDRYGRRILLLLSEALMVLGLAALGAFFNVKEHKPEVADGQLGWLPLVALVVFMIGYSGGLGPITYTVVPEILPQRVRGLVSSVATSARWGMAFLVTRFFYNLQSAIGDDGGYWFFAGICALGFFYIFFFIPETKGKTLEEIQLIFTK